MLHLMELAMYSGLRADNISTFRIESLQVDRNERKRIPGGYLLHHTAQPRNRISRWLRQAFTRALISILLPVFGCALIYLEIELSKDIALGGGDVDTPGTLVA